MEDTIETIDFGPNGVGGKNVTQILAPWDSSDPRYVALQARVTGLRFPTPVAGFASVAGLSDAQIRAALAADAPSAGPDPRDTVCYLISLDAILAS